MNCSKKEENVNIRENGYIYGKWLTSPNTYTISAGTVYCYLLIGEERALLIDTALGEGNLRQFVEAITDKPIIVVNTHSHYDHAGGNSWWQEIYAGPNAWRTIKIPPREELLEIQKKRPYFDYTVHTVHEGTVFDLENRHVEVVEIPAHHESSIALLDLEDRKLYCGDELEAGQVCLFYRERLLSLREFAKKHQNNMRKLKALQGKFDLICPSHNGTPLIPEYIDDYIALSQAVSDGTAKIQPDTAGYGFAPNAFTQIGLELKPLERIQLGGASFIYMREP